MTPPAAANGTHVLTPEFVALLRHRELADATAAATADAPQPRREPPSLWRRQHLDGDTVIRIVAASAVLGVAVIAAVVSYSHIYDLARHHGESGTAARLLPVSVDGLIASASLALLHAARNRIDAPWMAYLMLWLGVGATIAANVGFGLPAGWLSAVIAAWPAAAFVGSVEMALMLARNRRRAAADSGGNGCRKPRWRRRWRGQCACRAVPDADPPAAAPQPPSQPAAAAPQPPVRARKPARKPAMSAAAKSARADAELAARPHLTNAEIAKRAGVSERTVERRREAARKAATIGS
ncbi:MAG TPA: DUF2637 domain-containing protein [Streptosporangiaceae bacterium]|nr:DUF2637 domain-containing protein [Streptosporangiaceae bacterium]